MKTTTKKQERVQTQASLVTCGKCEEDFDRSEVSEINGRDFCPDCFAELKDFFDTMADSAKIDRGESFISDRTLNMAAEIGSEDQFKSLLEKAKKQRSNIGSGISEKGKEQIRKIKSPVQETKTEEDITAKSMRFLAHRIGRFQKKPSELTFGLAGTVFINYFRSIVYNETGITDPQLNENEKQFIRNFVHWLIGSNDGEWSPSKSLYFWTQLGVGKSTIALAGHHMMAFLRREYDWSDRYYDFAQMDEIFVDSYSRSDLSIYGKLAKGPWCIDELREDHFDIKHFGNNLKPIANMLSARHSVWKSNGTNTIITSNIPFGEPLRNQINDQRLYDRIKQQYISCFLDGPNKRNQ